MRFRIRQFDWQVIVIAICLVPVCVQAQGNALGIEAVPPAPEVSRLHATQLEAMSESVSNRNPYVGSISCSAAACHGKVERTDYLKSAFHFVMDEDPHTQAGAVLYNELSRNMVKHLNWEMPAWEAKACLSCHAPGAIGVNSKSLTRQFVAEGVGCEGCHGGAANWLADHRSFEWKFEEIWSANKKMQHGFVDTKKLQNRAKLCAECHVGTADKQVTHDLIAAGHPRLTYEFSAYHEMLPSHWNRTTDRPRLIGKTGSDDEFNMKLWLVGQLTTAESQLDLIVAQAEDNKVAWPDLAQFDCYACHHNLADPSWRQGHRESGLRPGQVAWGTWSLGLLSSIPGEFTQLDQKSLRDQENQLRQLFQAYSNDRQQAIELSQKLKPQLQRAMKDVQLRSIAGSQSQLLQSLLSSSKLKNGNWDHHTQLYLALSSQQSSLDSKERDEFELLTKIRGKLSFSSDQEYDATSPTFLNPNDEFNRKEQVNSLLNEYLIRISR